MRDWPWISDNALTLYCGVLFVENHTCMHVDETTGKCRSLTQSYKWVFFSDTNPDTCVPVSFRGPLVTVLYVVIFCHAPPPFFLSLYNPSRQQRITCSIWSHYFMRTTSTSLHFTYVDLWRYHSKEIVRDAEWTFSCIYMYHQFVYTHWFFFLLLKATKYSSYYILHKASSHQFDQ